MHFAVHLGGDDDLVPIGEVLQSASEDLLTRAKGIDVGGIEEIDPQLEGFLDDRPAVFFVKHPFVYPTFRVPEPHATEADARHIHSSVSELRVFHVIFLSFHWVQSQDEPSKTCVATVRADMAFGQPAYNARCVMTSLSSVSVRPFSFALVRWNGSCSLFPPVISAATVMRLRSRGVNSFRSQTSPNKTSSVSATSFGAKSPNVFFIVLSLSELGMCSSLYSTHSRGPNCSAEALYPIFNDKG